jgi:hypothetical protein
VAAILALCVATPAAADVAGTWHQRVAASKGDLSFVGLRIRGTELIVLRGFRSKTAWVVSGCGVAKRLTSWEPMTPKLPPKVTTIEVANGVAFAIEGARLFRLVGSHWKVVDLPRPQWEAHVLAGPGAIYAIEDIGMMTFASTDAGASFTRDFSIGAELIGADDTGVYEIGESRDGKTNDIGRLEPPGEAHDVLTGVGDAQIVSSGALVVATWWIKDDQRHHHREARASLDHGATWATSPLPVDEIELVPGETGALVAHSGKQLFVTRDGVSFDPLAHDGLPDAMIEDIATCGGDLLAMFPDGSVYAFTPSP